MEKSLKTIQDNLKKLKDQGLKMPGENKKLMDALFEAQGLEKEIILYDPLKIRYLMELERAYAIASWVPSQALDSNFNFYIPSKKDQEWACGTLKRHTRENDYSWTPFEIPKNNENKNKL